MTSKVPAQTCLGRLPAGNSACEICEKNQFMPSGHGRDNSGRLTRRTWLFAISLGSTFMMSLAMESIRERRIAVESFAGFVFLGVPPSLFQEGDHLHPVLCLAGADRRCHKPYSNLTPAEGSLLVLHVSILHAGHSRPARSAPQKAPGTTGRGVRIPGEPTNQVHGAAAAPRRSTGAHGTFFPSSQTKPFLVRVCTSCYSSSTSWNPCIR